MKQLDYIRVVLIEPSHPGNIGAIARAMANMGVSRLTLVKPADFPSPVATARAAGADNILQNAAIVTTIDQALKDCTLVIGASARPRSIQWPEETPATAVATLLQVQHSAAALVFGRESSGLTNAELERCHYLARIPVEQSFASLNLAAAVSVILYELRKQVTALPPPQFAPLAPLAPQYERERLASADDMRHFYAHLQRFVELIEFSDGRSTKLHRKMTRMFNRIQMYEQEVRMMRGLFKSVEQKLA